MQSVIVRPIISEKSMYLAAQDQYLFEVPKSANKIQIAQTVAQNFKVDVLSVNTSILKGKTKRFKNRIGKRADIKRAVVTIKKGQKIAIFEEQK